MARKTKLTKELQDRMVMAIQAGNFAKVAAEMVGIGETTFYRWLEEGEKPEGRKIYREFRESIKRAEAQAEVANVARIRQAADDGTWQAAAWYLERKHSERWGRKDRIAQEISGPNGSAVTISLEEAKKAVLAFLDEGGNDSIHIGEVTEQDSSGTGTMA